jgi:hypothetical protein
MAQGKNRKLLSKRTRKGDKGFPVATVAFYGPDNSRASKVVCAIINSDGADPDPIKKWFTKTDARRNENILGEVLSFVKENSAKSVVMVEQIFGCPHEEGIDYPEGGSCPDCLYWKNRDRFTRELIH